MTRWFIGVGLLGISCACVPSVHAQKMVRRSIEDGQGVHILQEVAAVLMSEEKGVKIDMLLPESVRPKGYDDLDIQQGDRILMVNRKRVKSVEEFQSIYEALQPGEAPSRPSYTSGPSSRCGEASATTRNGLRWRTPPAGASQ